jgi:hypothetical protein
MTSARRIIVFAMYIKRLRGTKLFTEFLVRKDMLVALSTCDKVRDGGMGSE